MPNSSSGDQLEKPDHLRCRLRPGEEEVIKYYWVNQPPPPGWEPLMALGGHLWRAALVRKVSELIIIKHRPLAALVRKVSE